MVFSVGSDLLEGFRLLDWCDHLAKTRHDLRLSEFLECGDSVPCSTDRLLDAFLELTDIAERMRQ